MLSFRKIKSNLLKERIEQASKDQKGFTLHDPIDDDPRYTAILEAVDSEVELELKNRDRGIGFCHLTWNAKQTILLHKYGVVWFSPADMNPRVRFD